jgi:cell division protein FtsN
VGPVNLDYAMTPDNEFADVHRLSFGYTFGGSEQPEPEKPKPKQPEQPVKPPAPKGPPVIAAAPATPQKPAPEPKATAELKPIPDPKAAPDPKQAAPSPAPAPKPEAPELYEVVLGSYQTENSAQSELKALRILGFSVKDAMVTYTPGSGYRVSLVRFNSRKSADQLAQSLIKLSFVPRVEVARH